MTSSRRNRRQRSETPSAASADFFTAEYLERRRQAMARYTGWQGADDLDPKCPSGHACGVQTSTRLTRQFRQTHRQRAMDISPQADVMVPSRQRKRAVKAIREAWPNLIVCELSQVVRFLDPEDRTPDGQPKPVIDLMLPWGKFQETILKEYVVIDEETRHRIPRLEAALVSKYAAMLSDFRDRDKKEQVSR